VKINFQKWQDAFDILKLKRQCDCLDVNDPEIEQFLSEELLKLKMWDIRVTTKFRKLWGKLSLREAVLLGRGN
jgi:hypothetical protein